MLIFYLFVLTDAWFDLKVNEMLEEKLQPYIQNIDNEVLSEPILLKSQKQEKVLSLSLSLSVFYLGLRSLIMHVD